MSEFDWNGGDEDIVMRLSYATAVYLNERAEVVIRQENELGEEDSYVIIPRERLPQFIKALQARLEE